MAYRSRRRTLLLAALSVALGYCGIRRCARPPRDPRVPDARSDWEVWYRDLFDREAPPLREAHGRGIVDGLATLWARVLAEGVDDRGAATFSAFALYWGEHSAAETVTVAVHAGHAQGLARLRAWRTDARLRAVAEAHLRLLERSDRWDGRGVLTHAESLPILALADQSREPGEFDAGLPRL